MATRKEVIDYILKHGKLKSSTIGNPILYVDNVGELYDHTLFLKHSSSALSVMERQKRANKIAELGKISVVQQLSNLEKDLNDINLENI